MFYVVHRKWRNFPCIAILWGRLFTLILFFLSNKLLIYIRLTCISNIKSHIVYFSTASGFDMFMIYCAVNDSRNRYKEARSSESCARIHLLFGSFYFIKTRPPASSYRLRRVSHSPLRMYRSPSNGTKLTHRLSAPYSNCSESPGCVLVGRRCTHRTCSKNREPRRRRL